MLTLNLPPPQRRPFNAQLARSAYALRERLRQRLADAVDFALIPENAAAVLLTTDPTKRGADWTRILAQMTGDQCRDAQNRITRYINTVSNIFPEHVKAACDPFN